MNLKKLQEVSFLLVELNLFLDTHPDNKEALKLYNEYSEKYAKMKKEYSEKFGPINNFGEQPSNNGFSWINSPWPWEN